MSNSNEEQEINTFTKWVNVHLKKRDMEVQSIFTDFQDGVKLINLYEQISGFEFGRYNKKPSIKVQSIENLRQVLLKIQDFMESIGVKLQYGAEQLYDGDRVQILGMLWVLISKFVIAAGADEDEETKSLKQELLQWCRDNTQEYDNVDITNFTSCWQNGLALCALIHHFLPEKLDYHSLREDDNLNNIKLATSTAESIGIDNVLDEEELATAESINERSVMTQVAIYRTHLKSYADKAKTERLEKALRAFEYNSKELADALGNQINAFNSADFGEYTYTQVQEALKEFFDYKSGERASLAGRKAILDVELLNLKKDRVKNKVEPYVPSEDAVTPEAVSGLFADLSAAEKSYHDRLQARIQELLQTVETYDQAASEFITLAQSKGDNVDSESAAADAAELTEAGEGVLAQFNALEADDLVKFSNIPVERVYLARDVALLALTGEESDYLRQTQGN